MQTIDDIDRKLLRLMQHDPDANTAQLAEQAGMTAASCWRRIEKLENAGVILGRAIVIDPKALGYEL